MVRLRRNSCDESKSKLPFVRGQVYKGSLMSKPLSVFGIKLGKSPCPAALIGMVVIKAILSLAVKPGSFLVSYSGISYFLLLLLAAGVATRNAVRNILGVRLFWALLAVAFAMWATN